MISAQKLTFCNSFAQTKPQANFRLFCFPYAGAGSLITVFGGLKDKEVKLNETEAFREITNTDFSVITFPADHFLIHSAQVSLQRNISNILLKK
jgi:surfactin synthase thioesterase subunit